MPFKLPAECLNEIFEYLEDDRVALHSSLLVNRFWCEISVRILWRNIWSFKYTLSIRYQLGFESQILGTLISCLPDESKNLLFKSGIFIATPTSKPPLFNYASYCKALSIHEIDQMILCVLENQQPITSRSINYNKYLVSQEILKMFMKQIPSLKELNYNSTGDRENTGNIIFTYFPGAINCLTYLQVLNCSSNICSEFYFQLSRVCCNIRSLAIEFEEFASQGLKDLISSQNNLKCLTLMLYDYSVNWTELIPSLTKHSTTLTKLKLSGYGPLSFISIFSNLQELTLTFNYEEYFEDFKELQYASFPQLRILKFLYKYPKREYLAKFLEINGKSLRGFCAVGFDNSLNLTLARFCPNLRSLYITIMKNEIERLKGILNGCQQLESIKVWCGNEYLKEKDFLEILVKFSSKNLYKLKLYNVSNSLLTPDDLEKFFTSWMNRVPRRSLYLIIIKGFGISSLEVKKENMEIIEKYKKLDVIRKFETIKYFDDFAVL